MPASLQNLPHGLQSQYFLFEVRKTVMTDNHIKRMRGKWEQVDIRLHQVIPVVVDLGAQKHGMGKINLDDAGSGIVLFNAGSRPPVPVPTSSIFFADLK